MNPRSPRRAHPLGISLLEVLVAAAIIAILVTFAIAAYGGIKERMTKAACLGRMKRIYFALDTYVKEEGHWPQVPEDEGGGLDEEGDWKWWFETLKPYGISKKDWLCPVEEKLNRGLPEPPEFAASYIPGEFDKRAMTPYRWNQPWLLERGDFHGGGNHIVMPDGSITNAPQSAGIRP